MDTYTTTIHDQMMLVRVDDSSASRGIDIFTNRMDQYVGQIDELNIRVDRSYDMMRGIQGRINQSFEIMSNI